MADLHKVYMWNEIEWDFVSLGGWVKLIVNEGAALFARCMPYAIWYYIQVSDMVNSWL